MSCRNPYVDLTVYATTGEVEVALEPNDEGTQLHGSLPSLFVDLMDASEWAFTFTPNLQILVDWVNPSPAPLQASPKLEKGIGATAAVATTQFTIIADVQVTVTITDSNAVSTSYTRTLRVGNISGVLSILSGFPVSVPEGYVLSPSWLNAITADVDVISRITDPTLIGGIIVTVPSGCLNVIASVAKQLS